MMKQPETRMFRLELQHAMAAIERARLSPQDHIDLERDVARVIETVKDIVYQVDVKP